LAPAVVSKVIVDEESQSMEVIVADDQLSLAIGKRGQNVRLAAQLTGWRLDIKSESAIEKKTAGAKEDLVVIEGINDMMAEVLVQDGYSTPAHIAQMTPRMLNRLLNLDQELATSIIDKAKAMVAAIDPEKRELLANSSAAPVAPQAKETKSAGDDRLKIFLELPGVGEATAQALADAGYGTIGDVIADSAEEVAQKTGLSLGVARTVQMAADRYLQS